MEYSNTTKGKFVKFLNLSLKDKLKTVIYSLIFHLYLVTFRLLGFKKCKSIIDKSIVSKKSEDNSASGKIMKESKIIGYSTGNTLFKASCLEKSLFSYFILGLYGFNCNLKIGINDNSDDFSAHAWIEFNNKVINDNIDVLKNFSSF